MAPLLSDIPHTEVHRSSTAPRIAPTMAANSPTTPVSRGPQPLPGRQGRPPCRACRRPGTAPGEPPVRHVRTHVGQFNNLMGVIRGQLHKLPMVTDTSLRKEGYGGRRFQQCLRMARMAWFASRLPSLALGQRRICGRRPAGVRRVLVPSRFERCQALKEGENHETHTHRSLVQSSAAQSSPSGRDADSSASLTFGSPLVS